MTKKILLVDDAETTLLMEKIILGKRYELITAKDGQDAIDKVLSERPDLVLLDVVMPVKDGFEACAELRGRDETREIPIIMVTTRGEAANIEKGYQTGCTEYIVKPINGADLLAKVRKCIGE